LRSQRWSWSWLPHGRQSHIFVAPSGSAPPPPEITLPRITTACHTTARRLEQRSLAARRWPAARAPEADSGGGRRSRRQGALRWSELAVAGRPEAAGGGGP